MNHKFVKSELSNNCQQCGFNVIAHTSMATCSVCLERVSCDVFDNQLACTSCIEILKLRKIEPTEQAALTLENEVQETIIEAGLIKATNKPIDIIQEEIKQIEPIDGFSTAKDFFNAETRAIVDIEAEIKANNALSTDEKTFELVRRIRERHTKFKQILFEAMSVQVEITSKQRAQQHYLNELASKIRKEEREKYHLADINYQPKEIPTKVKKTKISADEQLAANYAKVMKISIEQARILVKNQLTNVGIRCSCAETPGVCRIHNA